MRVCEHHEVLSICFLVLGSCTRTQNARRRQLVVGHQSPFECDVQQLLASWTHNACVCEVLMSVWCLALPHFWRRQEASGNCCLLKGGLLYNSYNIKNTVQLHIGCHPVHLFRQNMPSAGAAWIWLQPWTLLASFSAIIWAQKRQHHRRHVTNE